MILFIGLITIFLFGYILSSLISKDLNIYEKVGLSFGFGFGILTFVMFLLGAVGIPFKFYFIFPLVFIFIFRNKLSEIKKFSFEKIWCKFQKFSYLEKGIIIILFVICLSSLIIGSFWPINAWDSLCFWDLRGKMFFQWQTFSEVIQKESYPLHAYPLLTSLSHTIIYLFGGNNPQFIYGLFYISLLVSFYGLLKRSANRILSLLFTLLLAFSPQLFLHSTLAYANLPFAYYFSLGSLYLISFISHRNNKYLFISGILLGLSGWTRSSGELFFIGNFFVLLLYTLTKKNLRNILIFLGIYILLDYSWPLYYRYVLKFVVPPQNAAELNGYLYITNKIIAKKEFIEPLKAVYPYIKNAINESLGYLVYLFFLTIIINIFNLKKTLPVLLIIFSILLIFLIGSFSWYFIQPGWASIIGDSGKRWLMILPPIILFFIAKSSSTNGLINNLFPKLKEDKCS